jgi:hypothetical protein
VPLSVLPELIVHEARELLLLSDFDISLKVMQTALHLDLLHMEIKDLFVAHLVVTHKDALAEFVP